MITHDPRAALCGDRIITLRDGLIVGDESTRGEEPARAAG